MAQPAGPESETGMVTALLTCAFLDLFLQPLSKWATRFDLGLSTTVPVLEFEPGNISFIPDICGCMTCLANTCLRRVFSQWLLKKRGKGPPLLTGVDS